ncbi:hypothetical protein LCGC14_1400870 [marine sediment metagenome]|uniref:Uncharacterized protein n=1 Tax=marine sediment metagenome TaxID=412755 RepID=A0A0F9MCQ4_9ZZZZ
MMSDEQYRCKICDKEVCEPNMLCSCCRLSSGYQGVLRVTQEYVDKLQARAKELESENQRLGIQSRALLDRLQKQNGLLHVVKIHWMNSSHEDECPCIGPAIFDSRCLCGYDVFQAALWEAGLITQAEIDFKCGEDVPKPESWWTPEYKKGDDDEVQDN